MIKQPSPYERLIDDSELRFILKNYDPVEQPSQASMSVLEASIFAQIDGKEQNSLRAESRFPVWILSRDWSPGAAILAVLLILVSGFLIDKASFEITEGASLTNITPPTLMTLADEDLASSLLATPWGDDDDDDQ